ncbi:MAG TPA: hypothetical protein VGO62_12500, partial [Myxococcota bacterium]
VGTPGYVAPEVVLEGKTDDPRSDFYALGVTWFEMLTAQKPFTAKTAFALAMRHAHEPVPTPTSFVPYSPVPHPIEALVLRLMAKNPDDRPQTAQALIDLLQNLAEESQRALNNPTPAPLSLEPHQNTITATSMGGTAATGVVPFKTPGAAKSAAAAFTPATALSGTPQPVDMSQLIAALPKKKIAAAVLLGLAIVAAGLVALVFASVNAAERRNERRRPPVAVAPTTPAVAPTPPVVPPVPPVPPVVPVTPPPVETPAEKRIDRKEVQRIEKLERVEAREKEKAKEEAAAVSGSGLVTLKTTPPSTIFIDGDTQGVDSGFAERTFATGKHHARFEVNGKSAGQTDFEVVSGKPTRIQMPLVVAP